MEESGTEQDEDENEEELVLVQESLLAVDDTTWSFLLDPLSATSAKTFLPAKPSLYLISLQHCHLLASSCSEGSYYKKLTCD